MTAATALPPATMDWPAGLGARPRVLLPSELLSLTALVSFTAHQLGCDEAAVRGALLERFKASVLEDIPAARFDEAVRHLVDQIPEQATA